jgi:3-oxoacyl-[acyl-carrier protein] reductase
MKCVGNALVTGASRGIGEAIADELENYGAKVFRTDTTNLNFMWWESKIVDRLMKIAKNYGPFDIIVNNAGINKRNTVKTEGGVDYKKFDDYNDILQVNLFAPYLVVHTLVGCNGIKRPAKIVNISSIYGNVTRSGRNAYTASKAGIIGLTKAMALDLADADILVNSVAPGFTKTEMTVEMMGGEKWMKKRAEEVPLKRFAMPIEIAKAVCFLCSDLNTYITGQNIIVDGGFTCK